MTCVCARCMYVCVRVRVVSAHLCRYVGVCVYVRAGVRRGVYLCACEPGNIM